LFLLFALITAFNSFGQDAVQMGRRMGQIGQRLGAGLGQSKDSLKHRNMQEDSITISFKYLDAVGTYKLDSSVSDFYKRFPVPFTSINLGNLGTATKSLLFNANMNAGFDPGFHALDVYKWKLEDVRFFQTTRPYSELNYQLGSKSEQVISVLHTQNIKPNWNFSFQYRMINAPGFFQHQRSSHNNYLFTSIYSSKNLRYHINFVLLSNRLQSEENGGIVDTTNIMSDPAFKDRNNISTFLGGAPNFTASLFKSALNTGNKYSNSIFLLRQQYDLGKKDSLVTDSTVIPLFFPRLRFEHQLKIEKLGFSYTDNVAPASYYSLHYDTLHAAASDSLLFRDSWKSMSNDFSIYQFPDAKNLQQYIKLSLQTQFITGQTKVGKLDFINTAGFAAYRNKSKNQRWDIDANGKLYFTGFNKGDFDVHASLKGIWGKRKGSLELGFGNVNRNPAFQFDNRSSFYLMSAATNLKKENITGLFATLDIPAIKVVLKGNYYLVNNWVYLKDYYQIGQQLTPFNVAVFSLYKGFSISKGLKWHAEVFVQQTIGKSPLNLLPVYTRQRLAYEGSLGFKNLSIAMGVEAKYRLDYKADNYSPVLGQFFAQDSVTIKNKLPDLAAYIHFRIRPFTAFVRAENLNTAQNLNGFGFTNNNFIAPGYALPGLQIRVGIFWQFVN
jgi:hypothetical protein